MVFYALYFVNVCFYYWFLGVLSVVNSAYGEVGKGGLCTIFAIVVLAHIFSEMPGKKLVGMSI